MTSTFTTGTTDYVAQLGSTPGENAAVIRTAQEAVKPHQLDARGIFVVRTADGAHEVLDLADRVRELANRPDARKTGRYDLTDVPSFVDYLDKHAEDETELWADVNQGTVRAVINAHEAAGGLAGHQDHLAVLVLTPTKDWLDWTARDGKLSAQLDFAEFIEDHLPNFLDPSAADMLELAQTFQATTKVDFASSKRVASGETQLLYQEQQNASAGSKGQLAIPDTFEIGVQVFENGPAVRLQARFRYRINDGHLALGYRLTRPQDARKSIFDEIVGQVAKETDRTIWATS